MQVKWMKNGCLLYTVIPQLNANHALNILNNKRQGDLRMPLPLWNSPSTCEMRIFFFINLNNNLPVIDINKFILSGRSDAQYQNDICQICKCVLPLHLVYLPKCQHMFCSSCMSTLFKMKLSSSVPCPTCRSDTSFHDLCQPNLQIIPRVRDMEVTCNQCRKNDSLENMSTHNCSTPPMPNSMLRSLLSQPLPASVPTPVAPAAHRMPIQAPTAQMNPVQTPLLSVWSRAVACKTCSLTWYLTINTGILTMIIKKSCSVHLVWLSRVVADVDCFVISETECTHQISETLAWLTNTEFRASINNYIRIKLRHIINSIYYDFVISLVKLVLNLRNRMIRISYRKLWDEITCKDFDFTHILNEGVSIYGCTIQLLISDALASCKQCTFPW